MTFARWAPSWASATVKSKGSPTQDLTARSRRIARDSWPEIVQPIAHLATPGLAAEWCTRGSSAELDLEPDAQDRDQRDRRGEDRHAVEVLLDDARSGQARLDTATEQAGQAAALTAMQQDQQDQQQTGDDQQDVQELRPKSPPSRNTK